MRLGLGILSISLVAGAPGTVPAAEVGLMRIDGVIGPATASYVARAINVAEAKKYSALIIKLDTPGGLLDSTKEIVEAFYGSKVPTVVYVSPSGADAGSAGCFITLAADVAAMAPHTRIGAAHPVSMLHGNTQNTNDIMAAKLENDSVSWIASIAEKRGRNVDWAKSAVKESASITAEEALDQKVVDLIAKDIPDLLTQIDGREIEGTALKTAGATVVEIKMAARERLVAVLWRPEVMFMLMLAAMYGIIGELSSPGAILPGVVGAIALILVLCMSTILPINVAGLALIGLSVALFIIDVFAPTHGILTFGGIVAFFLGALMLFNRGDPVFHLSLAYIIPATFVTAAFFIFIVGAGLRAQRKPVQAGRETMLGKITSAVAPISPAGGKVFIEGEYWNAVSETAIAAGQPVEIIGVQGLTLKVKPPAAIQISNPKPAST